jgi:hypothetical protein
MGQEELESLCQSSLSYEPLKEAASSTMATRRFAGSSAAADAFDAVSRQAHDSESRDELMMSVVIHVAE